jgi:hypothetical protein
LGPLERFNQFDYQERVDSNAPSAGGRKRVKPRRPRIDDRRERDVILTLNGLPAALLAHKLKLFRLLAERPRSADEISESLGIARRPVDALLAVNASLGFVKRQKNRFHLAEISREYLLEDSPTYFGAYWDLSINNPSLLTLESFERALRTNRSQVYGGEELFNANEQNPELARAFTRGMHSISIGAALTWPNRMNLSKYRMMLDVGGGSGAHCIGAALKFRKLKATIFDLPPACDVATEFASQYGLSDRISTQPGDMWNDPFPPADLHFYGNIFHDWPPEQGEFLTRKSFEALPSGGRLMLHEQLYNDDKSGPFASAAYSMVMLAWTEGQQYSRRELADMMTAAGFRQISVKPSFGYMSIITGVKP